MSSPSAEQVRIPIKVQTWLFITNLGVQPAMAVLFFWMTVTEEGASRVFGAVMGVIATVLFGFSALAVKRTWGKTFEIVVDAEGVAVPLPVRGVVERVPFAAIRKAWVQETRTATTSFWALHITFQDGARERTTIFHSQFLGVPAFERLRALLEERGVAVG